MLADYVVNQRIPARLVGHVLRLSLGLAAGGPNLGGHALRAAGVDVRHDDDGTLLRKTASGCLSNPGAGAGNDRYSVFQSHDCFS